jgi:hypothetical protein
MKIDFINFPFAYTDTGARINVNNISGSPFVGSSLQHIGKNEDDEDLYEVNGSEVDPDCVGGVCPIK